MFARNFIPNVSLISVDMKPWKLHIVAAVLSKRRYDIS